LAASRPRRKVISQIDYVPLTGNLEDIVPLIFGFILLFIIYCTYKLFATGFLFKAILFVAGWFGLYIAIEAYCDWGSNIAITISDKQFSWAGVIPTLVCALVLLNVKVND